MSSSVGRRPTEEATRFNPASQGRLCRHLTGQGSARRRKKRCCPQKNGALKVSLDLEKHINYWSSSAQEDLETAEFLIASNRPRHGLFFAHLALEKALKAHICKSTQDLAPRMHNLLRLIEKTNLVFTDKQKEFLAIFDRYQLEGRYPEFWPGKIDLEKAWEQFHQAKEIFQWSMNQL